MKNARKMRGGADVAVMALLLVAGAFFVGFMAGHSSGYHRGQIDALSGHPAYTLATQPDGEVRWIERGK